MQHILTAHLNAFQVRKIVYVFSNQIEVEYPYISIIWNSALDHRLGISSRSKTSIFSLTIFLL